MSRTTGKASRRNKHDHLEALWDDLLSRKPEKVRAAYASLPPAEREAVITHLQRMTHEAGWQPEQRLSAHAALRALENQTR